MLSGTLDGYVLCCVVLRCAMSKSIHIYCSIQYQTHNVCFGFMSWIWLSEYINCTSCIFILLRSPLDCFVDLWLGLQRKKKKEKMIGGDKDFAATKTNDFRYSQWVWIMVAFFFLYCSLIHSFCIQRFLHSALQNCSHIYIHFVNL